MNISDELAELLIIESRNSRRPSMEEVLNVVDTAFKQMNISVNRITSGPPSWIWEDAEMTEIGIPRYYILSESNSAGMEGYPLFTIRQAYSVKLDNWLSMSSLVIGPTPEEIGRSIALAIVHHVGAFAGVKYTASAVAENLFSPTAWMSAIQFLLDLSSGSVEPNIENLNPHDDGKMVN